MSSIELLNRTRKSALRIMQSENGKKAVPQAHAQLAANLIANHWVKAYAALLNNNGRLKVDPSARKSAKKVAKLLEWMMNPSRCHGQQAMESASKTIRALSNRSITYDELVARCKEFGRLRRMHIDRNNARKPRAAARSLKMEHLNTTARWITSEVEIDEVGHRMGNCLANNDYADGYKSRLRKHEIELIVLENENGNPRVLICIDANDDSVEEVKGRNNECPIDCRDAIIEVLTTRRASVNQCSDLLEMGICDEFMQGYEEGEVEFFMVDKRKCEVGPNFLSVTYNNHSYLLRNENCDWSCRICVIGPHDRSYLGQANFRVWLRSACRKDIEFAQACATAFKEAPHVFRRDWLVAPRRA